MAEHWRQEWEYLEGWAQGHSLQSVEQNTAWALASATPYTSTKQCLMSLRLLFRFVDPKDAMDVFRFFYFTLRYLRSPSLQSRVLSVEWRYPLLRLAKLSVAILKTHTASLLDLDIYQSLLTILNSIAGSIPEEFALICKEFFQLLAALALDSRYENKELIRESAISPLRIATPRTQKVYEEFVAELLTIANIPEVLGGLEDFARTIDYELLAKAVYSNLSPAKNAITELRSRDSLLWLLAYFIYFRRHALLRCRDQKPPDTHYVKVASRLISFLADDIGNRLDDNFSRSNASHVDPLPTFVRLEILSLISEENVKGLLANMNAMPNSNESPSRSSSDASSLASYALTLLRAFPRRRDEIRLWLYRDSTSRQFKAAGDKKPLPAIKYFFQAATRTVVYQRISKDPRATVAMLQPDIAQNGSSISSANPESKDDQWRVVLLFLELYTFVLKVMDDEEFLSGTLESDPEWSWTRQSALTIDQVKGLTGFLKNLAFSMYWNATEIAGIEAAEAKTSLAEYFGGSRPARSERFQDEPQPRHADMDVAGISGMTLAYVKGMVTGVLRMVYERE